jgi:hypothetical protein
LIGFFKRSSRRAADVAWWRDAEAAAISPAAEAIDRLQREMRDAASPDERERREEFVEGLTRLLEVSSNGGLPRVETQHRVIGTDTCHFVAPAGVAGLSDAAGKLFLTSQRIVFASHGVRAWPWHRVRAITRVGRALIIEVAGVEDPIQIQCNSYGEAMVAAHMGRGLAARKT